jgi:PhnB protein
MAERDVSERLDELVEAILSRREGPPPATDPELALLAAIAVDLRDLPREDFRKRLGSDLKRRTSMSSAVMTSPEKAVAEITPMLTVRDAAKAIEFYKEAFGATEVMRLTEPGGKVGHAEIRIGGALLMLADEYPDYGFRGPDALGGSAVTIHLYVEDVDEFARRAVAAGAKLASPVKDEFYGDRSGRIIDPFGHRWLISTKKEEVTVEEMQRRYDEIMRRGGETPAAEPLSEGLHTVTPYLLSERASDLAGFLERAFGGAETFRAPGAAGGTHIEVMIGDSKLMMGGMKGMEEMPTALHLYVEDADAVYRRALAEGAASLQEPTDQFYGDREAAIRDPFGNNWYIATHKATAGKRPPEGLRSVTPFLHPRGADRLIEFLEKAFDARAVARHASPDGVVRHATIRLGDSMIEMGEAHGQWQPMPGAIYLYVPDVDATYRKALAAGAVSITEPKDEPYGDRNAGVKDPFGNIWYIGTPIKDVAV